MKKKKKKETHEDVERYLGGGPGVHMPDLAGSEKTGTEPRSLEEAGHCPMRLQGVTGIYEIQKKRDKRERGDEERKKEEKRGLKTGRKLNQSFQEHVLMRLK